MMCVEPGIVVFQTGFHQLPNCSYTLQLVSLFSIELHREGHTVVKISRHNINFSKSNFSVN